MEFKDEVERLLEDLKNENVANALIVWDSPLGFQMFPFGDIFKIVGWAKYIEGVLLAEVAQRISTPQRIIRPN